MYFDKSIVTERRTILLPCKERYYVEKQAVYTTIGKGKIRIGHITNSATTDINGQIVNLDSIYTNNFCLDSIISAYVDYDDKIKQKFTKSKRVCEKMCRLSFLYCSQQA